MPRVLGFLLIALVLGADALEAQRRPAPDRDRTRDLVSHSASPTFGIRGLYDFDISGFGIGVHVQYPIGRVLRAVPSAEVYFGDHTIWQANLDAAISLLLLRAGLGVAVVSGARTGDATDGVNTGLNLFAGLQSPRIRAGIRPFVDARWTFVEGETPFRLVAGVNIPMSGLIPGR